MPSELVHHPPWPLSEPPCAVSLGSGLAALDAGIPPSQVALLYQIAQALAQHGIGIGIAAIVGYPLATDPCRQENSDSDQFA